MRNIQKKNIKKDPKVDLGAWAHLMSKMSEGISQTIDNKLDEKLDEKLTKLVEERVNKEKMALALHAPALSSGRPEIYQHNVNDNRFRGQYPRTPTGTHPIRERIPTNTNNHQNFVRFTMTLDTPGLY